MTEIKLYKTKKEALENISNCYIYNYSYSYGEPDFEIEVKSEYFGKYKYRGEEKIVSTCKYDIKDLMENYKKYLNTCSDYKSQVYILDYIITYAILTQDWKKLYEILKTKTKEAKFFKYTTLLNNFQTLAIIYYANKTSSVYYRYGGADDIYAKLTYMSPTEIREIYKMPLFQNIMKVLESDKKFRKEGSRRRKWYSSPDSKQEIVELEQDYNALEFFLNTAFPKDRYESHWYSLPSKQSSPINDIIDDVEADPKRFIAILRNYVSNQYVVGKKYAELESRLRQIYDLIKCCEINASLVDVCEGLPPKIKAQAILAITGAE